MKNKSIIILLVLALLGGAVYAQAPVNKKERKKNLVIKEMNQKAGSSTSYLDNQRTFDQLGRKVEEIEYASYGQKSRHTYEYEGNSTKCVKEVEYNEKNKVVKIRKYEYNADGTKHKQYNYAPNGKLLSTKSFEYSYK